MMKKKKMKKKGVFLQYIVQYIPVHEYSSS